VIDCIVDLSKVTDYLLNPDHVDGAAKAKFFCAGGFERDRPDILIAALQRHFADNQPGRLQYPRPGCIRIIIDGPMTVPDGRNPAVRSVWDVDGENASPRLITAYPSD